MIYNGENMTLIDERSDRAEVVESVEAARKTSDLLERYHKKYDCRRGERNENSGRSTT